MLPPIVEDQERDGVWIGDAFVSGFLDADVCQTCGTKRIYADDHDAFFCPQCNLWLDQACGDALCSYCSKRPAVPLPRG